MRKIRTNLTQLVVLLTFSGMFTEVSGEFNEAQEVLIGTQTDLGIWDDVIACQSSGRFFALKGNGIYDLSFAGFTRKKLADELLGAELVEIYSPNRDIASRGSTVFFNSRKHGCFALHLKSGKVAKFEVPAVSIPGNQTAEIGSIVHSPFGSSIVSISGGDRDTWPRDGNRPVFFWIRGGEAHQFPVGWELNHFTADMRVAIFTVAYTKGNRTYRYPVYIDLEDAEPLMALSADQLSKGIPYTWTDKQMTKRVSRLLVDNWFRFQEFIGFSVRGDFIQSQFDESNGFISQIECYEDLLAFRLQ